MHKPRAYKPDLERPKNRAERREAKRKRFSWTDFNLPEMRSTHHPLVVVDNEQTDGVILVKVGDGEPVALDAKEARQLLLHLEALRIPVATGRLR